MFDNECSNICQNTVSGSQHLEMGKTESDSGTAGGEVEKDSAIRPKMATGGKREVSCFN